MINGESRSDNNSHNNNDIVSWVMNMVRYHIFSLSLILLPIHPCPAVAMIQAYVGGKKNLGLPSARGKKPSF